MKISLLSSDLCLWKGSDPGHYGTRGPPRCISPTPGPVSQPACYCETRAPDDVVATATSFLPPRLPPPAGSLYQSRTHQALCRARRASEFELAAVVRVAKDA